MALGLPGAQGEVRSPARQGRDPRPPLPHPQLALPGIRPGALARRPPPRLPPDIRVPRDLPGPDGVRALLPLREHAALLPGALRLLRGRAADTFRHAEERPPDRHVPGGCPPARDPPRAFACPRRGQPRHKDQGRRADPAGPPPRGFRGARRGVLQEGRLEGPRRHRGGRPRGERCHRRCPARSDAHPAALLPLPAGRRRRPVLQARARRPGGRGRAGVPGAGGRHLARGRHTLGQRHGAARRAGPRGPEPERRGAGGAGRRALRARDHGPRARRERVGAGDDRGLRRRRHGPQVPAALPGALRGLRSGLALHAVLRRRRLQRAPHPAIRRRNARGRAPGSRAEGRRAQARGPPPGLCGLGAAPRGEHRALPGALRHPPAPRDRAVGKYPGSPSEAPWTRATSAVPRRRTS